MKLIVVYTYCCTLHVQTCKINLQNIYKKKKEKMIGIDTHSSVTNYRVRR